MNATLHFIYDPLCGWCYGAEPLVRAAEQVDGLDIELHAGGLWPAPTRLSDQLRSYIQQADARIASLSGQAFTPAYLSGLLQDPNLILDSRPPIAAVLAAQSLDPARALPMLRRIQHAHYEEGRHVVEPGVLRELAADCGISAEEFDDALSSVPVDAHIEATRRLMSRVGAPGFPTFVLQLGDQWTAVPNGRFVSDAPGFADWLSSSVKALR